MTFFQIRGYLLGNIRQLSMEFHRVNLHLEVYMKILQGLYKHGFKTIWWEHRIGATTFEIVFRKTDLDCPI